jgi:hypothetical protein
MIRLTIFPASSKSRLTISLPAVAIQTCVKKHPRDDHDESTKISIISNALLSSSNVQVLGLPLISVGICAASPLQGEESSGRLGRHGSTGNFCRPCWHRPPTEASKDRPGSCFAEKLVSYSNRMESVRRSAALSSKSTVPFSPG